MIEDTAEVVTAVQISTQTKFAQTQTALMTSVLLDTQIPVNLDIDVFSRRRKICLYSHVPLENPDNNKLEKRLKTVEKEKIEFARNVETKFETLEIKIDILQKSSEEKDKKIMALEKRLNDVEKLIKEKLTIESISKPLECFQCDKCNFSSSSEHGLKTHTRKKHKSQKEFAENISSQQCTFCDLVFNDEREMKKHMRTHSYSLV